MSSQVALSPNSRVRQISSSAGAGLGSYIRGRCGLNPGWFTALASQNLSNLENQFVGQVWFFEEVRVCSQNRGIFDYVLGIAGDEQEFCRGAQTRDDLLQLKTIQSWHGQIADHHVERFSPALADLYRLLAILRFHDLEACPLQHFRHELAEGALILHDQYRLPSWLIGLRLRGLRDIAGIRQLGQIDAERRASSRNTGHSEVPATLLHNSVSG